MPDNLVVAIGADLGNFHEQIELAKKDLRDLGKEIKAANDAGNTRLATDLSKQWESTAAAMRGLTRQLGEARREVDQFRASAGTGLGAVNTQLAAMVGGINKVREAWESLRRSIIILEILHHLLEFAHSIDDVNKSLQDMQNIARATSFPVETVATFQAALRTTGQDAGIAGGALQHFQQELAQSRVASQKYLYETHSSYQDLTKAANDAFNAQSEGFKTLQMDAGAYSSSLKDQDRALVDVAKRLKEFKDAGRIDEADIAAGQLFGRHYLEIAAALDKMTDPKFAQGLAARGLRPTAEDIKAANEYDEALTELQLTLEGMRRQTMTQVFPVIAAGMRALTTVIQQGSETIRKAIHAVVDTPQWKAAIAAIQQGWSGLMAFFTSVGPAVDTSLKQLSAAISAVTDAWNTMFSTVESGFASLVASIKDAIGWAGQLVDTILRALGLRSQTAPSGSAPTPMALGGRVPGIGTGDTVPAMLTPGEFVNRVGSVQYYGADLFRALNARMIPREMFNGYAFGGLVDDLHAPVRGFANGGLVSTASGTPVHLHLNGNSFALSAAPSVATALVHEAGRQQMRSAGVKPSWYGGRPGA